MIRLFNLILNRNLLLYLGHTRRQMESLMFTHWIFEVVVFLVIRLWRIACHRRWRCSSEIDISSWEPCKFGAWLERPVRVWLLARISYFLTSKTGKVVIACSRLIEISTHCLNELFLTCSIENPTLSRVWIRDNRRKLSYKIVTNKCKLIKLSGLTKISRMSHVRILVSSSLLGLVYTLNTRFYYLKKEIRVKMFNIVKRLTVSWFGPCLSISLLPRHFMGLKLWHLLRFLEPIRRIKRMLAAILRVYGWNSNYVIRWSFSTLVLIIQIIGTIVIEINTVRVRISLMRSRSKISATSSITIEVLVRTMLWREMFWNRVGHRFGDHSWVLVLLLDRSIELSRVFNIFNQIIDRLLFLICWSH